jgi:hypothetical protein
MKAVHAPPHPTALDPGGELIMNELVVVIAVAAVVVLFVLVEIAAAVVPILIIIVAVPPDERHGLAELVAAADSSPKLRLWPALRVAVAARRGRHLRQPEPVLSGRSRDSRR